MAFNSLPGMRVVVTQFGQTFIVGDYFAVFEDEAVIPDVYLWTDMTLYSESPDHFAISFDRIEYTIPKTCFENSWQIIRFRSIAEGQLQHCPDLKMELGKRIIPSKNNYYLTEISESFFSGTGVYTEKEINAGSISHVYGKFKRLIWITALCAGILCMVLLRFFGEDFEKNWLYFLIISLFAFLGVGVLIYLIFCIVARHRYSSFLKFDVSTVENIVFVVAPEGFGAVEQCIYGGKELIPWSLASYFYETKFSVVIVCKDKSICCIPKRFFQKSSQNDLVEFIAQKVKQD